MWTGVFLQSFACIGVKISEKTYMTDKGRETPPSQHSISCARVKHTRVAKKYRDMTTMGPSVIFCMNPWNVFQENPFKGPLTKVFGGQLARCDRVKQS